MDVILRQDVEQVGLRGEVVDVAAGFARNYLLPRKLAETATPAKVAELRKHEQKRARHEAQSFEQAQEIAQKLEGAEIRFDAPAGETGTSSTCPSRSSALAATRSQSSSSASRRRRCASRSIPKAASCRRRRSST